VSRHRAGRPAPSDSARRHFARGLDLARRNRLEEAAGAFAAAAACDDRHGAVFNNLGSALYMLGRLDEAADAWRRALALTPDDPGIHLNLANVLRRRGDLAAAVEALERAIALGEDRPEVRNNLGRALHKLGRREDAAAVFRAAVAADPTNAGAAHWLAALTGETPAAPPAAFVTGVFDALAPGFDRHLTEDLGYATPRHLRALLDRLRPAAERPPGRLLDLGCGTGLSGAAFADAAAHLTGVDLSAPMLSRAREKGVYDALYQGDLVEFLAGGTGVWDLFVAADTLCYIGDLAPVFAAVQRRAAAGAWFLLSVERARRAPPGGYRLRPTGRYAHGRDYLAALAEHHGLRVAAMETAPLRKERGAWVEGLLAALCVEGKTEKDGAGKSPR